MSSGATVGPRFSVRYIPENLRVNGLFYLYDERFPVVFSLLAVAGLLSAEYWRERAAMAIYFFLFFATGLVFYAGSYNYGADVRYSLMTYPPIAVLAGLGASRFVRGMSLAARPVGRRRPRRGTHRRHSPVPVPLVCAGRSRDHRRGVGGTGRRTICADISPVPSRANAYVLTHNPGMFHVWGVNAGQMSLATSNPAYVRFLADRYPGGIFLHWNFWCNVQDPAQPEMCRQALTQGVAELVAEHRERDQRFAFYQLKLAK